MSSLQPISQPLAYQAYLLLYGVDLDIDGFLASITVKPVNIWRKGEPGFLQLPTERLSNEKKFIAPVKTLGGILPSQSEIDFIFNSQLKSIQLVEESLKGIAEASTHPMKISGALFNIGNIFSDPRDCCAAAVEFHSTIHKQLHSSCFRGAVEHKWLQIKHLDDTVRCNLVFDSNFISYLHKHSINLEVSSCA